MDMTEQDRETAEKVRRSSEYIKAADSFARYAHSEWIADSADKRALLMCCVDRTIPEGIGYACIVTGDGDLIAAALMTMQQDEGFSKIFRKACMASDAIGDVKEQIDEQRQRLRVYYGMAGLSAFWTLCVIFFQITGTANWITTISNLLLMAYVLFMIYREIKERRRKLKRLTCAMHREREERINRLEQQLRSFMDMLKSRLRPDDDDDE